MKMGSVTVKLIYIISFILILSSCKNNKEQENAIIINLIKNGSFEEISGDSILYWSNVDTYDISHDVPPEGGNNSLTLEAADVSVSTSQKIIIPFERFFVLSFYTKIEGKGTAEITLKVKRQDSTFVLLNRSFKDTVWTFYTFENLKLYMKDTLTIVLSAFGGISHSVTAFFDLIKLENIK